MHPSSASGSRRARALAAAAFAIALLGTAEPAAASEPQDACAELRKSYRQEKLPVTLFHLAECEEKAGRIATAAVRYDEYLEVFERLSPPQQRDEKEREQRASQRRDRLEPDIPRVTFKLPESAPVGTRVTRVTKAGTDPLPVALGVPLPIDPGEHYVMIEPPGGTRRDKRFFVQKGDQLTIDLPLAGDDVATPRHVKPLEPVPVLLPPTDPGVPTQRIVAYVAGGIGAVALVTGIVTGALAWSQKGVVSGNCRQYGSGTGNTTLNPYGWICSEEGQDAADLAEGAGAISTVTFPMGLIGVGLAVVLVLTEPEPSRLGGAQRPAVAASGVPAIGVGLSGEGEGFVGARWVW